MKLCEFIRPASLPAARDVLRELGARGMILAGGTALHFMQDHTPVTAVDITRLGLSYIRGDGEWYRIGATTPLSEIQRFRAPRWALHEICRQISTHQIRNISTIGGNIARVFPWADLPVALLAMGGEVEIYGAGSLDADRYFGSQPAKRFLGGDILTEVRVPVLRAHQGVGMVKVRRTAAAFSMVTVGARLDLEGGIICGARVAAGAAIPFPRRLRGVEEALVGKEAVEGVFKEAGKAGGGEAAWRGREGMSAGYSRRLAETAIFDALQRAAAWAEGRKE